MLETTNTFSPITCPLAFLVHPSATRLMSTPAIAKCSRLRDTILMMVDSVISENGQATTLSISTDTNFRYA